MCDERISVTEVLIDPLPMQLPDSPIIIAVGPSLPGCRHARNIGFYRCFLVAVSIEGYP